MDRVRAYRNKKSQSKSYDLSSAAGPLAQGMSSGQPEKEAARKGDPDAGLKEFLVDVSEAKVRAAYLQKICDTRSKSSLNSALWHSFETT